MSEEATLTETEVARLFRREALVSDAGLRIDAAERVERGVAGDDDVELERVQVHVRGDASEYRGARERHVAGRYERSTGGAISSSSEIGSRSGSRGASTITRVWSRRRSWAAPTRA